jgi:malonyl-CoA O-methyltransferase
MVANNPNYYDEIASGYDELHANEQEQKLAVAKQLVSPKPPDKLLDVGCGSGVSTQWDCNCYGCDPSKKLIAIAKEKRKGPSYVVAPAEKLPFENEMFEYVISLTAIQNFSDIQQGLQEMKRVLKKEGLLVISTLKDGPRAQEIKKTLSSEFSIEQEQEYFLDVFWKLTPLH